MLEHISLERGMIFPMEKAKKEDCYSIEEALEYLGVNRQQLYNYLEILGMERRRFPKDRRSFVLKSDIETIKRRLGNLAQ